MLTVMLSSFISKLNKNTKILNLTNQNIKGTLVLTEFCFLEELYCSHNEITCIVISNKLKILDCSNNQITFIHIPSINKIKYLNCSHNLIKK